jgi:translation initiation factor IF-3
LKVYKVNSQITTPQVRLIGEDGKQIGVLARDEALDFALGQGSDMVLIGENANPPVARIIDFKKFLYQEQKKEAEARKGQKNSGTKEVRVGSPFAGTADVENRITRTRNFLSDGFNVKVVIKFSGRQITHPEFGHKIFDQFKEKLADCARVEREAKFEGKQLVITFAPNK